MEATVERGRSRMEHGGICDFSHEVLLLILSRLNAPDAIRASAVCKQWNGIIQTLNHVRFLQSSPVTPYCMRIRKDCQELELYGLNECMRLCLDFLSERYNELALLACGGGLLLFHAAHGVLVVCSPITLQWHELPWKPLQLFSCLQQEVKGFQRSSIYVNSGFQRPAISVILQSSNQKQAAKIFLSGYKDERVATGAADDFCTRVYDLETQSWTSTGLLPVKDRCLADGVDLHSHIYTVTHMGLKSRVISYDLETNCWSNLPAGVPACVMHPYLVQHSDALLLIGACHLKDELPLPDITLEYLLSMTAHTSSFGIRIWQLSECKTRWDEVARMPQVYQHFLPTAWFLFDCVGSGDVLYFAGKTGGTPQLAYDFATDQWLAVPKLADNKSGISYSEKLFLYHPSSRAL